MAEKSAGDRYTVTVCRIGRKGVSEHDGYDSVRQPGTLPHMTYQTLDISYVNRVVPLVMKQPHGCLGQSIEIFFEYFDHDRAYWCSLKPVAFDMEHNELLSGGDVFAMNIDNFMGPGTGSREQ